MKYVYNKNMKSKINIKNIFLLILILFLLTLGCINTYGASFTSPLFKGLYVKQIIWCIFSIIIFFLSSLINKEFIYKYSLFFYIVGIILLILVLFFGSTINGAASWFKIGVISFQPSELFKPFYLVFLARYIQAKSKYYYIKLLIITLAPFFLIFIEPDSGLALMYLLMSMGVIIANGGSKKIIKYIGICIIIILTLLLNLYIFKKELLFNMLPNSFYYRIDRVLKTDTYQIKNALIGMGSSGIKGHGLTSQKVYIPEMISDFAFSLLIMNFGYLLSIIVIIIYAYILFILYRISKNAKDNIVRLITCGIIYMMTFQCAEHILMNLGLAPITGITLPFLSYGGSSIISYSILFSLIIKTTNSSSYN